MNVSSLNWKHIAPLPLMWPHFHIRRAVAAIVGLSEGYRLQAQDRQTLRRRVSRMGKLQEKQDRWQSHSTGSKRSCWDYVAKGRVDRIPKMVKQVEKLCVAFDNALPFLMLVEHQFGAVNADPVEIDVGGEHLRGSSWHAVSLELIRSAMVALSKQIGDFTPGLNNWVDGNFQDTLTHKRISLFFSMPDFDLPEPFPSEACECKGRLVPRLEQELFRAWKEYYSDGSSHETLMTVAKQERETVLGALAGDDKRPSFDRDHFWRRWAIEEGYTPAKIRDRWNAMTDEERKTICATAWQKVGTRGKDRGREVVKKALQRAEKEADAPSF